MCEKLIVCVCLSGLAAVGAWVINGQREALGVCDSTFHSSHTNREREHVVSLCSTTQASLWAHTVIAGHFPTNFSYCQIKFWPMSDQFCRIMSGQLKFTMSPDLLKNQCQSLYVLCRHLSSPAFCKEMNKPLDLVEDHPRKFSCIVHVSSVY